MRDAMGGLARGRAVRRVQRVAMRGRPVPVRVVMSASAWALRRAWGRLSASEQQEVQGLLITLASRRRLEPAERERLQQLAATMRGGISKRKAQS